MLENIKLLLYHLSMKPSNLLFSDRSIWNTGVPTAVSESLAFYVSEAGHFHALPGYAVSRDYLNSFLLLYTLKGSGMIKAEGETFITAPGTLSLIDCHRPHYYGSSDGNWEFLWIHYSGSSAGVYSDILSDLSRSFSVRDKEQTKALMNELIALTGHVDNGSILRTDMLMTELFYSVTSVFYEPASDTGTESLTGRIAGYIREHYSESLTVTELSRIFNVSCYHLIRIFKKNMGLPPYNYLINHRITEAKKLLVRSEAPVSEIAARCGFTDCAGFIACFKSRTGQTPLQYRKDFRS